MRSYQVSELYAIAVDLAGRLDRCKSTASSVDPFVARATYRLLAREVQSAIERIRELALRVDPARDGGAIPAIRGGGEPAVVASGVNLRNDGWLGYLDELAADERECQADAIEADRAEAMAEWKRHATAWDMCEF